MSKKNKYTKDLELGEGYIFIRPYLDLMIEAEEKTGKDRYEWHRMFDAFIFEGKKPTLLKDLQTAEQIDCWNKLINELELYTAKKGKYSANWKGGVSDENHRIRTSKEYREWRAKVFQRDKFTCQICGQVGGELNAHHIKHFSKDKANRLNVDNGITLCAECHRLVHKVEGK